MRERGGERSAERRNRSNTHFAGTVCTPSADARLPPHFAGEGPNERDEGEEGHTEATSCPLPYK